MNFLLFSYEYERTNWLRDQRTRRDAEPLCTADTLNRKKNLRKMTNNSYFVIIRMFYYILLFTSHFLTNKSNKRLSGSENPFVHHVQVLHRAVQIWTELENQIRKTLNTQ